MQLQDVSKVYVLVVPFIHVILHVSPGEDPYGFVVEHTVVPPHACCCVSVSVKVSVYVEQSEAVQVLDLVLVLDLVCKLFEHALHSEYADQSVNAPYAPQAAVHVHATGLIPVGYADVEQIVLTFPQRFCDRSVDEGGS